MARRTGRDTAKTEAHYARKREISESAAALFVAEGVATVSMDDIAREVGLAKATVYHYFRTKDEILYSIHEYGFKTIEEAAAERKDAGQSPMEQLRGVFQDGFGVVHNNPGYSRVVFEHLRHLAPAMRRKVRNNQQRYESMIREILDEGVADGSFEIDDTRLATLAFFGMVNWSHQWYSPGGQQSYTEIADYFYRLFVRGIGSRRARQQVSTD